MGAPGSVVEGRRRPRRRQVLRGQLCALAALALLLAGCAAGRGGECGAMAGPGLPRGPPEPGPCEPGAAPTVARNLAGPGVRRGGAGPDRPGVPRVRSSEPGARSSEPSRALGPRRSVGAAVRGSLPAALRFALLVAGAEDVSRV